MFNFEAALARRDMELMYPCEDEKEPADVCDCGEEAEYTYFGEPVCRECLFEALVCGNRFVRRID